MLVVAVSSARAFQSQLSADQIAQGWIQIFDGKSQFGWIAHGGEWQVAGGTLVAPPGGLGGTLRTTTSFSDFDLKFEARVTGGPATLRFRVDPQSRPSQPGLTLSLNDGTIAGVTGDTHTPASSGWNQYELRADGTHVMTALNGKPSADGTDAKNRIGYFEFHAPRGTKLEVRSVVLEPLGLDPLYNGSNLDGWRSVGAPAPQEKSKLHLPIPGLSSKQKAPANVRWQGQDVIHGQSGVGQLESTNVYDDFILQFAAKTSTESGHAGVELFFRGTPNQFDSGYAIDANDEDLGHQHEKRSLGGLSGLTKAREVPGKIGDSFAATVVARAHQFSVWIDGIQVTDYYDSRPEGNYHAASGPLGFRMKSDKSVLDLRAIRIASLAKGPEPPPPIHVEATAAPTSAPAASAAPMPPQMPAIIAGPSPQEKAQKAEIQRLTVAALSTSSPEESVRINKQILTIDPGDMPAQQRLDKAQAQLDAAGAEQQHSRQQEQASAAQLNENNARRAALLGETQSNLLRGDLHGAQDRFNDAQRLGAGGPEVDRLRAVIASRIRNRLLMRVGLGSGGLLAVAAPIAIFWRRRHKTITATLVALDGPDLGKSYLLNMEVTHMGGVAMDGGKKNEVLARDPDRQVSRFHCEIHKRGPHCYLIDLDSSNGTFLNNKRLQPGLAVKLRDGDKFSLARASTFELRLERRSTP
jgi:hypothetical protein